jgi:hypothetical protein
MDSVSTSNTAPSSPASAGLSSAGPTPFRPDYAAAPYKPPLSERINFRMIILGIVALVIVGGPFFIWARATLSGGIINHGDYTEADLKAMSLFEMDQYNGQINDVPQRWRNLDGKPVELVGEVWAPHGAANGNIHDFQLCYSIAKCCFSGPPQVQHFVYATVDPDSHLDLQGSPTKIFGILHVGIEKDGDKIKTLYRMDVKDIRPVD